MSKKFEQLLDLLVNEEMDKANELFHEIVVEKSREIYENMIAEETAEEEVEEEVEEEIEEEVEEESVDESFGAYEGEDDDAETAMTIGGENDPGDSLPNDVIDPNADSEIGDEEGSGEVSSGEEQIIDILSQLKAEFQDIVQQHSGGQEEPAAEPEFGDDSEDDGAEGPEDEPEDEPEAEESMGMPMREYVEKVGNDWDKNSMKTPRPVGHGTGDLAGQATETSTKSVGLQNPKRITTSASAHNILGDKKVGAGTNVGTSPVKPNMGIVKAGGEFTKGGTHNVNNVRSGIKTVTKVASPNRTAEFKPVGAATGGPAGQTGSGNTRSPADRRQ